MTRPPATATLALAALVLLAACDGGGGTGSDRRPASVSLSVETLDLPDGDSAAVSATLHDQQGAPIAPPAGTTFEWSTVDPTIATVAGSGAGATVKAVRRGEAKVSVRVGALRDSVIVTVRPAPAVLSPVGGDAQQAPPGGVLPDSVVVRVADRYGDGVGNVYVRFTVAAGGGSASPPVVITGADGRARTAWTLGPGGEQRLEASIDGLPALGTVGFAATAAGEAALAVTGFDQDSILPGATLVIRGRGFSPTPAANQVYIDGVLVPVAAAGAEALTVNVPDNHWFVCRATASTAVTVAVGTLSATGRLPMRVAPTRAMAVGAAVSLEDLDTRCNALPGGGRYLVSVHNADREVGVGVPYQLRGEPELPGGPAPLRAARTLRFPAAPARDVRAGAGEGRHLQILEANRSLVRRLGPPPRRARGAGGARLSAAMRAPLAVGDTTTLRVPDLNGSDICSEFISVSARVVHAGPFAVVLEDRASPLAGTMDADYQALGREMDEVQLGILRAHFGDPLAYDAQLDANGRVLMLFSPTVNEFGGVLGFITSVDFYPRSTCAASNVGEIFFSVVPGTAFENGYNPTREDWARRIQSTVIHETKHIASYAERFARGGGTGEESWLEESTARISEELWARVVQGFARGENVRFDPGVRCDYYFAQAACAGEPLVMSKHFGGLYGYLRNQPSLTPIGRSGPGDASFYASGWSLVRWAADHSGRSDAEFFSELTRTTLSGLENLEARTGRSWGELLGDWSLALAVDERPSFTPASARHTFPSWDLRDVFAGMNLFAPNVFTLPYPVSPPVLTGVFSTELGAARGGSAAVFEVVPPAGGRQVLELRGADGGLAVPTLRITILRVQ